ncbi:MAG: transporter substrate-binding domain-containing protein [Actinomycetia bacterium]|nr:transporter substrate-binding domain-containing protein [Actinomycetes bacterium]
MRVSLRRRLRATAALVLALFLLSALSGCSVGSTIKGWFSSPAKQTSVKLTPKVKPPLIHEAGKLYIGVNLGMAPFAAKTADGYEGFDVALGRSIAKHLGLEPVFVATAPDTMAAALSDNSLDIALSAPTDVSGLVVAQVYYQDTQALFAQSSEASAVAATPRLPKTALQENSAAQALLVASMPSTEASATLQLYPALSAAIKACEKKQTKAVAGDYAVLRYAQLNGAKIRFVRPLSTLSEDRGVAIRADNLDLMRKLKPILGDLDKTGVLGSIMHSWIGDNQLTALKQKD